MTGQAAPDEQVDRPGAERRARRWDRVTSRGSVALVLAAVALTLVAVIAAAESAAR
jgi:hypothetical protein